MSYLSEVLTDAPAAYYRMDETSGAPQDSSGNAQHATVVGGTPTYSQTGAITSDPSSTSIDLDGATEYFTVPNITAFDFGDVFTLEAWVARDSLVTTQRIFDKKSNGFLFTLGNTGAFRFGKQDVATIVSSTATVSDNNFHHYVVTKSGATTKLYLDGVDVTGTVTDQTIVDNDEVLTIGANYSLVADFVNGRMDELALYPTALHPVRVAAHYNAAMSVVSSSNAGRVLMMGVG